MCVPIHTRIYLCMFIYICLYMPQWSLHRHAHFLLVWVKLKCAFDKTSYIIHEQNYSVVFSVMLLGSLPMLLSIIYQSPILIKDTFFIEAGCLSPFQYTCDNWQWVRLPIVLDIIADHIYLVSFCFFVFFLSHSPSRELKLTLNAWSVSLLLGLEGLDTRSSSFMLTRGSMSIFPMNIF